MTTTDTTTIARLPPLFVVNLLVVLYALCYQLQSPLEPFLVDQLVNRSEESSAAYARLQSFFSLMQMVGSFIVGYMLDFVGLRGMFALNFLACAACYALLASATSIELLYAAKLPAMFQTGFLCAQAAAAKLTAAGPERATALGRLTSAYTVGGVVGPALGGYLGVQAAARLAVVGSLCAAGLVMLLPSAVEERQQRRRALPSASSSQSAAVEGDKLAATSWTRRMSAILPLVWPLLVTKMSSGFVNSAGAAARPLILKDFFHFDQTRLGVFMSAMFFGNALLGLQLGRITTSLGGALPTIVRCLGAAAVGHAAVAAAFEPTAGVGRGTRDGGVWLFMGLTLMLSLFQFPMATTITAQSTALVR